MIPSPPRRLHVPSSIIGVEAGPLSQRIDPRWVVAYAAALGEHDPRYFDTGAPSGPLIHPLFAVCYEWPVALELRAKTVDPASARLAVHATHRLVIHRYPRVGDTLLTTGRVVGVGRRRPGTLVVIRFSTVDEDGRPVTTTDHRTIYRGVETDGDAGETADLSVDPPTVDPGTRWEEMVDVSPYAAHVYSECARIWNPIHTDLAVARAAGLPGLILHGTATLAMTVSRVLARDGGGDPMRVREVRVRFTGLVRVPSCFTVRGRARRGEVVGFDAIGPEGRAVLSEGVVGL